MKRIALPLLALVLVSVVGLIAWLSRTADPGASAGSGGRDSTAAAARSTPLVPDGAPELATPAADASEAARALAATSADAARLDGRVHVRGSIRPPQQGGVDAELEVFALSRAASIEELFSAIDPRPAGEKDTESAQLVLEKGRVDASGRFDLALPKDVRKAHVIFAGRAWFLREAFPVDLRGGASSVVLQAELGGWIEGRVAMPAGLETRASELDGDVARLAPTLAASFGGGMRMFGGRRNERRAAIRDGRFELRAVDPTGAFDLTVEPRNYASVQQPVTELAAGRAANVTVALARGGVVRGSVKTSSGAPVAGATLEARVTGQLFGFDDRTVRTGTANADGSFELAGVAAGKIQVSARGKGLADAEPARIDVSDGVAVAGVDLVLSEGKSIAGLVTWADGTPAAQAEVTVALDRAQMFNFGGGAPGAGGRGGGGRRGGGMTGAMAQAFGRGNEPKFTTDAAGRFTATGLGEGPYTVTAEALPEAEAGTAETETREMRRKRAHRASAPSVAVDTRDTVLALAAPLGVRGRVTDAQDKPLAAFTVQAQQAAQGGTFGGGGANVNVRFGPDSRVREDVRDSTDGSFFLVGLKEGKWRVSVSADDYVTAEAVEVTLPQKSDEPPLAFQLVPGATVTGFVKSPQGAPVGGATIAVVPPEGPGNPMMRFGGGGPAGGADEPKAQSDGEGRFTLRGLKAGKLALGATSKQWAKSPEVELTLAAGQTVEGTLLLVRAGGRITGEVFEDGRPAAGRTVQGSDTRFTGQVTATTDARGHFEMDHVEPGSWRLMVMPSVADVGGMAQGGGDGGPGGMFNRMKMTSADVVDGEEVHVVLGAPPEDPVVVHGRVTHAGEPVAGVNLAFSLGGASFGPGGKNATTKSDGTYSITLDKPGEYSLMVTQGGRGGGGGRGMGPQNVIEYAETIPARKDVTLDLALPTGRISGRVTDPDGNPAANARVSLRAETIVPGTTFGGGMNEITTDAEGQYDLQSLRAGTYSVQAGGTSLGQMFGGGEAASGRELRPGVKVDEGEWVKNVDFALKRPAKVEVEVTDERNEPVANATVFARDEAGRAVDRMSTTRTDSKGVARYGGLAPGKYTFSARKDALASGESTRVEVGEGGGGNVRIALSKSTLLYVKTVDASDAPVRSSVRVFDEGGREMTGLMGMQEMMERFGRGSAPENPEQKIGPLAPGKYRVEATATDGRKMERAVTLAGQADKHLTLSFAN